VIVYSGQCFENYRSSENFGATLFHGASYVNFFLQKLGWATYWAIVLQTSLVTLPEN
jgi:hypothetical protein